MAPPVNNLIMSGTLIRSCRHLEHQNPSIISKDIGRARSVQQFRRRIGGSEESDRRSQNTVVLENRIHSEGQYSITEYVGISSTSGMTGIINRCMAQTFFPVSSSNNKPSSPSIFLWCCFLNILPIKPDLYTCPSDHQHLLHSSSICTCSLLTKRIKLC